MKKIVILLLILLSASSIFASESSNLIETYSFVNVGPNVGYAMAIDVPYVGLAGTFGTVDKTNDNLYIGTVGHFDVCGGIQSKDRMPLVLNAFGGAAFCFDLGRSFGGKVLVGPSFTWQSIISDESSDSVMLLALGGGLEGTISMYFNQSKTFGLYLSGYGTYCFNLANTLSVPKHSFMVGGSVGLTFSYGKIMSTTEIVDRIIDKIV